MSRKNYLFLLLSFLLWASCAKQEDGFNTDICFRSMHHQRPIPDVHIYLKYNADLFPGYENLDAYNTEIISDQSGEACIKNLPIGNHWAVGFGYDSLLQVPIRGSMQFQVKLTKTKRDTTIFVTEY